MVGPDWCWWIEFDASPAVPPRCLSAVHRERCPDIAELSGIRLPGEVQAAAPDLSKKLQVSSAFPKNLAETEGFEPSVHLLSVHSFSKRAPSATRPRLHDGRLYARECADWQGEGDAMAQLFAMARLHGADGPEASVRIAVGAESP